MPEIIQPHSLKGLPALQRILSAALQASDPALALRRFVGADGPRLSVAGRLFELPAYKRVHLLSIGKAALPMARALNGLVGPFLYRGLIVTKNAGNSLPAAFELIEAGHPIPDQRSLRAGRAVADFLQQVGPDDLLICAISGGASSLIASPRPPIDLDSLQRLTAGLLACGADIREVNTLRRHVDALKGGGFLRATRASVLGLILSDVPGDTLADIASGPTAPDPTTRDDALEIIRKYNLSPACPAELLSTIKAAPETLKPGDDRLANVHNLVIGSNRLAVGAALEQAALEGFHTFALTPGLSGEACRVGVELCGILRGACERDEPVARPFCMAVGGETTVTLQGHGRGGRNTELALAAAAGLAGLPDALLVAFATDGEDGPTDAAGAVVSGDSLPRARALGLPHPLEVLRHNDSYTFFSALDDLIKTGPTGTNVNDLVLLFGL